VLERRQPERAGFALLLMQGGRPAAFVKLRPRPARGLAREAEVLDRLERVVTHAFHAPVVLEQGAPGGLAWLALSALPGPHRVPRAPGWSR
jgi:aminoglycoside phosphotransferase